MQSGAVIIILFLCHLSFLFACCFLFACVVLPHYVVNKDEYKYMYYYYYYYLILVLGLKMITMRRYQPAFEADNIVRQLRN